MGEYLPITNMIGGEKNTKITINYWGRGEFNRYTIHIIDIHIEKSKRNKKEYHIVVILYRILLYRQKIDNEDE